VGLREPHPEPPAKAGESKDDGDGASCEAPLVVRDARSRGLLTMRGVGNQAIPSKCSEL